MTAITPHSSGKDSASEADLELTLAAHSVPEGIRLGASVAVSGVCLTVTSLIPPQEGGPGYLTFDVMPQTMRMTALGRLSVGSVVNLERALRADGRLDGHVVQGHVDGVARLVSRTPGPRWDDLRFALVETSVHLTRYIAPQGSIAVSGVSLTVTGVDATGFSVSLIPTTLDETTLGGLKPGQEVNIEVDVLAKYVERMMSVGQPAGQGHLVGQSVSRAQS